MSLVFEVGFAGNAFAENPICPPLIEQDDRHKRQRYHRHHFQGVVTRRGIVNRQAKFGVQARYHDTRVQSSENRDDS